VATAGTAANVFGIVVRQPFENSSDDVSVWGSGSEGRIKSLRQAAVAPAKFLSAGHYNLAVIRRGFFTTETTGMGKG